jgi:hypothetical protein
LRLSATFEPQRTRQRISARCDVSLVTACCHGQRSNTLRETLGDYLADAGGNVAITCCLPLTTWVM